MAKIQKKWTTEECALLKEHYGSLPLEEICQMLGRSKDSIKGKARGLKIVAKRWTRAEESYLIEYYPTECQDKMVEILNRSWATIQVKACRMGITRLVTKEDFTYIYNMYFPDIGIYKIGVSNDPQIRKKHFGYKAEIMSCVKMETDKALKLEKYYKSILPMINTGLLTSGNTETYKI
jgi:hypothetical protein